MFLNVEHLTIGFDTAEGVARAVEDISFSLDKGGSLCLVGESGCGKSVTAMALARLLPTPPARVLSGRICFAGIDMGALPEKEMDAVRGGRIGVVFQEPMTSLNPVFTIGDQLAEPLILHRNMSKKTARREAVAMLDKVGIPQPEVRAGEYPHQLSGGMLQRVMIAIAVSCRPELIIADEPTTALDVTLQGQILALLRDLRAETGSALLLISHDLDVVAGSAEEVAVMYAGRIVESGGTRAVLSEPLHPYTQGLMRSRPRLTPGSRHARLHGIPGTVPPLLHRPKGCAFSTRCEHVLPRCRQEEPPLVPMGGTGDASRLCRCWLPMN